MVFGINIFGNSSPVSSADAAPTEASVPLDAIPDGVLELHPELKLTPYDPARANTCTHAAAFVHNAARLEMADMWADIIPSLSSRSPLIDDATDLAKWWGGFARFILTTSMVDDLIMDKAYGDILEDFDKDATRIKSAMNRFREKNVVTLEIVCRAMGNAVELFVKQRDAETLARLTAAWRQLTLTLHDIYSLVEKTTRDIDTWRHHDIAIHKDLPKRLATVYTNKKRWGADDTKRGEMIVILTRWMGTEPLMRQWMNQYLSKRELAKADRWMDQYRANRLALVDAFHQRFSAQLQTESDSS